MTRFGYWSIPTVVAPEPYIDINIEPASSQLDEHVRFLHDQVAETVMQRVLIRLVRTMSRWP